MKLKSIYITVFASVLFSASANSANQGTPKETIEQMKQQMQTGQSYQEREAQMQQKMNEPVTSCEHLRIKQVKNTKMVCFFKMRFNQPITKEKYFSCAEQYLTALIDDGNHYAYPNIIKLYTKENMTDKAKEANSEFDKLKQNLEFQKYSECFAEQDI